MFFLLQVQTFPTRSWLLGQLAMAMLQFVPDLEPKRYMNKLHLKKNLQNSPL
jgi:hypothetical protein